MPVLRVMDRKESITTTAPVPLNVGQQIIQLVFGQPETAVTKVLMIKDANNAQHLRGIASIDHLKSDDGWHFEMVCDPSKPIDQECCAPGR